MKTNNRGRPRKVYYCPKELLKQLLEGKCTIRELNNHLYRQRNIYEDAEQITIIETALALYKSYDKIKDIEI